MADRKLWRITLKDDEYLVHHFGVRGGLMASLSKHGSLRILKSRPKLPHYIEDELFRVQEASPYEIRRGYTYGGESVYVEGVTND